MNCAPPDRSAVSPAGAGSACDFGALDRAGLNLHAVLDLDDLPADIVVPLRRRFDAACRHRQLILIGHAGTALWAALKASAIDSDDPIDEFTVRTVEQWFAAQFPGQRHALVYPGAFPVGLQSLGRIAGWHHASPFMVGIDAQWGSWFAYRAVLLADTGLPPSPPRRGESPCPRCAEKACIAACPGGALAGGTFALEKCLAYRKATASRCKATCLARLACPVGSAHRYCDEQMHHVYSRSMKAIERFR